MNNLEFIESSSVRAFVKWIGYKLDKPNSFIHSYTMKRGNKEWHCDSIYSAFEKYQWKFKCVDPFTGKTLEGRTFKENQLILSHLSEGLRQSVIEEDIESSRQHCLSILEWGGVLPNNKDKILNLDHDLPKYLDNVRHRLKYSEFDTKSNYNDIIMNSGFTKIYSLLIDDFIIYDGRVGAALGLLVRMYCEENNLSNVPIELYFAYGNARTTDYKLPNRRNPSTQRYRFHTLNKNNHTENNLRGNWLLKEILDVCESKFNLLHPSIKLRALESALFMIGYEVMAS